MTANPYETDGNRQHAAERMGVFCLMLSRLLVVTLSSSPW
eukprot:CAMPEP_0113273814 /NCGR_PEP_ID=MMETSP0008_2-20120614/24059_1 /TAXON_ID=97485 /ORGANISM="Prymnesium parvum" /LENGTH=39 /DNA_ID=CAMNT_0000123371 /DNA_START=178 /DNA_END=297 /DNA_ORIENTATION=+ /assembly_acc=CAM_ASM_000153